jgi:hypothetical protein
MKPIAIPFGFRQNGGCLGKVWAAGQEHETMAWECLDILSRSNNDSDICPD